ncbi:MAG: hypothetical protein JSR72_03215 [Proteobacteria bacterium]|nr:hypothetical protein [Pseudomonadota bacterium]
MKRSAGRMILTIVQILGLGGLAFAQAQGALPAIVTPEKAVHVTVAAPSARTGVFLDIVLNSYKPPTAGPAEIVISLSAATIARREVGRIAVFPAEPFTAANEREQRGYRFDATAALDGVAPGAPVAVELSMQATTGRTLSDGSVGIAKVTLSPGS